LLQLGVAMVRPWIRMWHASALRAWKALPRPLDAPFVHAAGVNPSRLLLLGNGPAVGYGVLSHDLALSGKVAQQVSALTGRGVDVEIRAAVDLTARTAQEALAGVQLERFDAVLLTLGNNDALRLTAVRQWRRAMARLLDHFEPSGSIGPHTFVLGIPPMASILPFPPMVASLADRHARKLNEQSRVLCTTRASASYIPFDPGPAKDLERHRSAATYADWARFIAGPLAHRLVADGQIRRRTGLDRQDEEARQRSVERLRILDTPPEKQFDEIAVLARNLFGTTAAALTFIDGDRLWFKARTGIHLEQTERSAAFCDVTISRGRHFVVRDASKDMRFQFSPLVSGPPKVRFYAGYAIEGPDGARVGALCIMDDQPRDFSLQAVALLRKLALMAQEAVWSNARVHEEAAGPRSRSVRSASYPSTSRST
jgi:hypothetical protein